MHSFGPELRRTISGKLFDSDEERKRLESAECFKVEKVNSCEYKLY